MIRFKSFLLLLSDIVFFSFIYQLLIKTLNRPIIIYGGIVLLILYVFNFWYFRFYSLDIYLNKLKYLSKILKINLIVFVMFWGIWWFFLKSEWPSASRLFVIMIIFVFGVVYVLSIRLLLLFFLIKSINFYTIKPEKSFIKGFKKAKITELNSIDELNSIRSGFLFMFYKPSKDIKTRADMWSDYLSQIQETLNYLKNKDFKVFFYNIYNEQLNLDFCNIYYKGTCFLEINSSNKKYFYFFLKKIFDFILSISLLPIILILHPFLYFLINKTFGKPVIFKQLRVKKGNKLFYLYKYRTMSLVSGIKKGEVDKKHKNYIEKLLKEEEETEYNSNELIEVRDKIRKIRKREEILPLGLLLRKTSIDELPQIINVLKSEMSFVGPRPILEYEYDLYPDWSKKRLDVNQGITGLWQICGRGKMPLHTSLFIDVYYSLNSNLWLDTYIFFNTIKSVFNVSSVF